MRWEARRIFLDLFNVSSMVSEAAEAEKESSDDEGVRLNERVGVALLIDICGCVTVCHFLSL